MNAIEFKDYIERYLNDLATVYGVTDLSKYYSQTDLKLRKINTLTDIEQAFAQYIMHAQNGTMIGSIVNFFKNYEFLKNKLSDFNPVNFLRKYSYSSSDREGTISRIIDALRFDNATQQGLKWSTDKSEKKDFIITRFANTLIDGALYFQNFKTKQQVVEDLQSHYINHEVKTLIKYVMSNFKHGFSVALCCDFLKEFDSSFDLPKPDVHLMEILAKYKGYSLDYYKKTPKRAFECISDFESIVNEIKTQDRSMTAYKLDRQIWLCCTGKFFLDDVKNIKNSFMSGIN